MLFIFAAVYFVMAFDIPTFKGLGSTPLTAQFMPKFWGACLMILSALLVLRGARQYSAHKKSEEQSNGAKSGNGKGWFYNNYAVVLSFVFLALYVALLEPLGFIISTLLYVFFGVLLLTPPYQKRNYIAAVLIAVVTAVLLDYVFVVLLNVLLPKGLLGF